MILNYDGWCRRIDLNFRSRFPYIKTRIFKVNEYDFLLYVETKLDDFKKIEQIFSREVKYATAPIKLVQELPEDYQLELEGIGDKDIPSSFEGIPFTINQMYIHIASVHPDAGIAHIKEDHTKREILIELNKDSNPNIIKKVKDTADALKFPYTFRVVVSDVEANRINVPDEVFNIAPSQARKMLSCEFIERDENLWYENVDAIYSGSFKKSDLYFIEPDKTRCIVNFSKFKNANLRNHLMLYDVTYCALPLAGEMKQFLSDQKLTRDELLDLVKRGRIKIINMQPETRMEYGFINEAYQENPKSVVSRRALAALCVIDLVDIDQSYIFSDPEIEKYAYPLIKELSEITKTDENILSDFLLWPKQALRKSLETLNQSGPMGIARYGINNAIVSILPSENRKNYEFEFLMNSDQIHLAHALDATYFPFFIDGDKYSDHPYALMIGGILNFYKNSNYQSISQSYDIKAIKKIQNPSLSLISIFDINDYIPILQFENEICSSVVHKEMGSLFSELSMLEDHERNERIAEYNDAVIRELRKRNVTKHALSLGEDALGLVIPFLATGKKFIASGTEKAMKKFRVIQEVSDFIEDKTMKQNKNQRRVSLLSKINRVARLKRDFD